MSQKRGGLKGAFGMSHLHLIPALCPHGLLDLSSLFLGNSSKMLSSFKVKGGHSQGFLHR